jgi:acyl carrier protein
MMTEIERRTMAIVGALIKQKDRDGNDTSDDKLLATEISDLQFDSLEKMELIMEIEDAFGVLLDEQDVLGCRKVADLVSVVKSAAT